MTTIVYTAIVGAIGDRLYPALHETNSSVRYVCFTDKEVAAPGWGMRPLAWLCNSPRATARKHKALAHLLFPGSATIWIDGCLTPKVAAATILADVPPAAVLAAFRHPERDCVYAEHAACLRHGKDDPGVMARQMDRLRSLGYPPGNGLAETSCLVRRPGERTTLFNETWWALLGSGSVRDQLSFDFVCWQLGLSYTCLRGRRDRSPYFDYRSHRPRRPGRKIRRRRTA